MMTNQHYNCALMISPYPPTYTYATTHSTQPLQLVKQ